MSWLIDDPLGRFIAQLVIVVALARVLGRVARMLGQPAVVAEIIGGILLGPSILGALAPAVSDALFPPGSLEPLATISQLGVLLFVFLVGLEVETAMLRGRARATVAIAITGIVVPFVLGAAVAVPVYELVASRSPRLDLALFVGAAMSVTAFPVLARILGDHRLLRTRLGALAIACAAVEDVIAWCLLAFVIAFVRSDGLAQAALTTALAVGFVAAMLLVVRPLLARLFARTGALSNDLVAVAVLGALGSAWVSDRIGIHLVFGAFMFGALVPKRDGLAHALADKLEAIVVVVFLPLFFVVSGLRTHVGLVGSAHHALACLLIVGTACAGKIGGTLIAGRATGLQWREAGALGILMNTRGLMELIVLNVGFELGVLDSAMFSLMIVMVLVTTMITSPVLSRVYPARDAIRELVAESEAQVPVRGSEERILACISSSSIGPAMISIAGALGGEHAEITALHLTRDDELLDIGPEAEPHDVLAPALARAGELALQARALSFASHDPANDIVRVADLRAPDVVLLGLHEPVLGSDAFGGVVHDVLRHAEAQVAVFVDRGLAAAPPRLLVAFRGGEDDRAALRLAGRIQRSRDASLVALVAADRRTEASTLLEHVGARAELETIDEAASGAALLARAGDCDLIVAGISREPDPLIRGCAASLLFVRGRASELARAKVNA
ncbi:MAG TPA: cation:proton antiporter [Kofleriaceae bacterium]